MIPQKAEKKRSFLHSPSFPPRVEDDVLIGQNGEIEVLSQDCPKSVREVEELCSG